MKRTLPILMSMAFLLAFLSIIASYEDCVGLNL